MSKSHEKLQLDADQSTHLLKLGLERSESQTKQDIEKRHEDMLYDMLASTLPVDRAFLESLPAPIRSLSPELRSLSGMPLGDLLGNRKTRPTVLRRIKDHAKEIGKSAQSETERETALVVYYAAIATALLVHKVKISEHEFRELEQSFGTLSRHKWIPSDLRRLFKKARRYGRDKA